MDTSIQVFCNANLFGLAMLAVLCYANLFNRMMLNTPLYYEVPFDW